MEDKNCQLLFEYLRSILYDPEIQTLDVSGLDEPYQKLGMGMNVLEKYVREMKEYSAALSRGNLSVEVPPRDNLLCENLKNIHANLNNLTWQAKQVAKGDYTQTVSYLGEFSEAFNTMTHQLSEREKNLKDEAQLEKDHAEMLELEAYFDTLTKIGNRYYFYKNVEELVKSGAELVFCYCDLDHLKYVNDTYGHAEGDRYIRAYVETVKKHLRETDVFARLGGDEFCVILKNCSEELANCEMAQMQKEFEQDTEGDYPKSFSVGIVQLPKDHGEVDVEELLRRADQAMYRQKFEHRRCRGQMNCTQ